MTSSHLSSAAWRTSSYSGANGSCVEVAPIAGDQVAVRDSKDRGGPALVFTAAQWRKLASTIKEGSLGLT
jgi:hypothetical protein